MYCGVWVELTANDVFSYLRSFIVFFEILTTTYLSLSFLILVSLGNWGTATKSQLSTAKKHQFTVDSGPEDIRQTASGEYFNEQSSLVHTCDTRVSDQFGITYWRSLTKLNYYYSSPPSIVLMWRLHLTAVVQDRTICLWPHHHSDRSMRQSKFQRSGGHLKLSELYYDPSNIPWMDYNKSGN